MLAFGVGAYLGHSRFIFYQLMLPSLSMGAEATQQVGTHSNRSVVAMRGRMSLVKIHTQQPF